MNRRVLRDAVDAVLAIALAGLAVLEIWVPFPSVQGEGSPELSTAAAVVLCLSLAFRRRWPLTTALIVLLSWPIAFSIQPILVLFWGQLVPLAVATYSVARFGSRRAGIIGAVAAAACLLFFDFRVEVLQEPGEIFFHWLILILAWTVGTLVRLAEQRATVARERAIALEAESRTQTLLALAGERARIARELHDVVAHAVSVMVVQAGAAELVVEDDPAYARRALGTIRTTGAEALTEMRRVVSMLRENDGEGNGGDGGDPAGPLRPQPGAAALPALIADTQAAGLPVTLRVHGSALPLAPGLDLAVYRIVQEALTNVRRHANATRAEVELRYDEGGVAIEVCDDGRGADAAATASGNGLVGMRERAALYGGQLDVAVGEGGGFIVRAQLPSAVPS